MVEMTIALTLLLTLTLGFVDLGYAFYQWNVANKAVQAGARAASVSNPVATALLDAAIAPNPESVGFAMPKWDASTATGYRYSCTGTDLGEACDQANFDNVFSRMAVFFPRLQPANVRITYTATGLGYWSRPGGPVPTITVSLEGLDFQFFFLSGLIKDFTNKITMPSMLSTVTGEDMKSTYEE